MRNFKRALALVLAAILVVGTFATVSAARAAEDKWYQIGVDYLQEIGVDYISPSQAEMNITREEFVLWVAKIESHQLLEEAWDDEIADMKFTDVVAGENQFAAIAYAHQSGFIKGEDDDGDGVYTFAPTRFITLGEVAAIVVRLMGYDDRLTLEEKSNANWAYNYMRAAQNYCYAFDSTFLANIGHYNPYVELTYGEAAYIIATIMNQTGESVSHTADGIKLDAYFTDTVKEKVGLIEDRYFVVSIGDEVVLQNVNTNETITVPANVFAELVKEALGVDSVSAEDFPAIGSLINVIIKKSTGEIVRITYEVTKYFTTILNTYLANVANAPDFYWSDITSENGEIKSAHLYFDGQVYTVTNGDDSDLVFYFNNTMGERMTVAEAIANLIPVTEGCVYAVFSAVEENFAGEDANVVEDVRFDTVVIKDDAAVRFVGDVELTEDTFGFVVKAPASIGGDVVHRFTPATIMTGIIQHITVYDREGYYLATIKLADGTLAKDVKIPLGKDKTVTYDFIQEITVGEAVVTDKTTYTYDISKYFPLLEQAESEEIKAGITSNLEEATAIWLNDRCVKFALGGNNGDEVIYLESAADKDPILSGFVASAVNTKDENGEVIDDNVYTVQIAVANENGVYDLVTEVVRARASSIFDLANYKVYARIWSNSLLHTEADNEAPVDEHHNIYRVEGQTDLIYVNLMKDDMSQYLLCSTGDDKVAISDDWKDIYGGHVLGEVVYNTEFIDADGDGLEEKKVVSVASIVGYEPYYERTLLADGTYTYVVKYTRVVFFNDYQLVDYGLQIALELMRFQFTFGGQIENGGDLVLGDEGFLMYEDIKEEERENYTQEKGWYVFDKEVSFKKGNNTIVVPEGAVLKLEDNAEVVYKTLENGEYDYQFKQDRVEFEVIKETTLWNVAFNAEGIAAALNDENVFGVEVKPENVTIAEAYSTIVFGKDTKGTNGVYIDVEADDILAYRVADNAEILFVVPSANGFTVIEKTFAELEGSGVFGVEWNAEVKDNEITAIAIITMGEVLEAEVPAIELPAPTQPEIPVDPPVNPPVDPTYKIVEFNDYIELAEGQSIVYFNKSSHMISSTVQGNDDYYFVLEWVGATALDGSAADAIEYLKIDMNSGKDEAEFAKLAEIVAQAKENFFVVENNTVVVDEALVVNGKLNTKTAEIVTIAGETKTLAKMTEDSDPADGKDEYVDLSALTVKFVSVDEAGDLVVEDGTFAGVTTFEFIAIDGVVYVIK